MNLPFKDLPSLVIDFIVAHPYQTALHAVNDIMFLTPAAATVPFFAAVGIPLSGPVGDKHFICGLRGVFNIYVRCEETSEVRGCNAEDKPWVTA